MTDSLARLLEAAATLKRLPRTGWLLAGVAQAESVADHAYGVALLALALADTINADPAAGGLAKPLNVELVLRIALLHDLAECEVTDLPRRAAERLGRETKRRAETEAFAGLTDGFAGERLWRAAFGAYVTDDSPEARLVHDADRLEMVHQALVYRAAGSSRLDEFLEQPVYAFAAAAELHAHLLARA